MYSSLSSRNLVFNNNIKTTRLLECYVDRWKERYTCVLVRGQMEGTVHLCIGTWADGRNGTPVFLVGFRDDWNAPVERMCSERHDWSAL